MKKSFDSLEDNKDNLVICKPLMMVMAQKPGTTEAECDFCSEEVSIFESTLEKCKAAPNFHIICWGCLRKLAKERGITIEQAGRIRRNGDEPWRVN